jgi:hypothetical protein
MSSVFASAGSYRLYFLDSRRHIIAVEELACSDDEAAQRQAARVNHPGALELWSGAKLIAEIQAPAHAAAKHV